MQERPTETIYERVRRQASSAAEGSSPLLVALIGASLLGVLTTRYQPFFDHDRVYLVEDSYTAGGYFDIKRSDFPKKMLTCESSFTGIDVSCKNDRKIHTAYYCQRSADGAAGDDIKAYRVTVDWNATCDMDPLIP